MDAVLYREFPAAPGAGLACLWTQVIGAAPYVQRVVPDGCIDLIWSDRTQDIHVAGPDTGPLLADLAAGEWITGVRFLPGAGPPALGVPADALVDARVPLADLWGWRAHAVAEEITRSAAPEQALERAVTGAGRAKTGAGRAHRMPGSVESTAATARLLSEGLPVGEAAARLGLSERQLRRRCLAAFGYGPKTLQRIVRFQRALRLARAGVPFAEVAAACGFADQAHLAHEVRALAGCPLGELL